VIDLAGLGQPVVWARCFSIQLRLIRAAHRDDAQKLA